MLALALAAPASATTFCVPNTSFVACPGGSVGQANLETAMQANASDGVDDRIVVAAGTFSDTGTLETNGGSDDLEIVGAGPGATLLTSSLVGGNDFVVNLAAGGNRPVTMRDLTIVIPASFTDGMGGAIQAEQDTLDNVDIESRNQGGSDGAQFVGGGAFLDGRIYGSNAGGETGSIGDGIRTNGASTGGLEVQRSSIENASWGVVVNTPQVVTFVRRTRIVDPVAYGVRASNGAIANVHNSLIVTDDAIALVAETGDTGIVIFGARHVTIVDTGGANNPAIDVGDTITPASGSVNAVIRDTIIAGNQTPLKCDSPMSNTSLNVAYSYFFPGISQSGNCNVSAGGASNLDASNPMLGPPQFAGPGDFHLPAGSPAIDAGDPLVVSLPTEDLDGAPRPVDGNGDGDARRDMGAFEYQPPAAGGGAPPSATPAAPKKRKRCRRKKKRRVAAAESSRATESAKRKCRKKRR